VALVPMVLHVGDDTPEVRAVRCAAPCRAR
jgi:hypothetical protein